MATTGQPLGIGLGIDFTQLDADLSKVADRIDQVGADSTLKVGTLSGLGAGEAIDTDKLGAQMGMVGARLSQGMASGVGASSALMLSFAARIGATLDRLAGVTIALFTRIDAAMRFPRFDAAISSIHVKLANVWTGQNKNLSQLDIALAGGMGKTAQRITKIFQGLFEGLGKSISGPIEKALAEITAAVNKMAKDLPAALRAIPAALTRPMETALAGFVERLAGMMGSTQKVFKAAGEADGRAFMFGLDSAMKTKPKTSFVTDPKDLETLKKKARALRLAERIPPPPPIAPLPVIRDNRSRRLGKTIAEEIKPPSTAAFENFFQKLRGMSRDATAQMVQDFQNVKSVPPQRPEPIKGRVAPPSLGKEFLDVGKGAFEGVKTAFGAISSGITDAKTKFNAFSKAGYTIDQLLVKIGNSMRGWGVIIAVPLAAFLTLGKVVVTAGSFIVDMGALIWRSFNRWYNLLTSIGGIGKKTFSELYQSHGLFAGSLLSGMKVIQMVGKGLWDLVSLKAFRRVGDDAIQARGAIGGLTSSVGKLIGSVTRLGASLLAAFGVVGVVYKVVEFFKSGVKGAVELNSTVARSKAVFGESFGDVAAQAEKNSRAFHVSKAAQLDLASSFGSMAQGAGVAESTSAALANELTDLSVNMTGLGIPLTDISEAMKTGLSGRAISLKQFAVNIDENTTKAYAWRTGIAKTGQELTTQQTLIARAGQIMRGLSYAQDALTKGASMAGTQFKAAGGGLALFAERIGEMALPALQAMAVGFNELMGGVLDLLDSSGPAVTSWAQEGAQRVQEFISAVKEFGPAIVTNMTYAWAEAKKGPLGFVIDGVEFIYQFVKAIPEAIGIGIRNAGTLWEIAKLQVGTFAENAMRYINTIPANFEILLPWLKRNWFNLFTDVARAFGAFANNFIDNAVNLGVAVWDAIQGKGFNFEFKPLLDGFEAATEKLPELIKPKLVDASEETKKLFEKIGQDELKRPKFKGADEGAMGGKQSALEGEKKDKEYKLGGALEIGSKEAFSAIAKGASGRGSTTDAVKEGITVQRSIHKAISDQTQVLKDKAFSPKLAIK